MVTPDAKRGVVAHVVAIHGVSQRRACEVLAVDRSSIRYKSVRPDDAAERAAMKAVAAERRRFGYRRIHIMLERQGIVMNLKKLRRLYSEEKLQVRKRGGRKRALGTRRPMVLPQAANERWSLDFISDAFTDGRRFRVLAVVDDFTRECLTLIADTSLSGTRVARELDAIIARRGRPRVRTRSRFIART
jgi:putative transposase